MPSLTRQEASCWNRSWSCRWGRHKVIPALVNGQLPLGRHSCTLAEVESFRGLPDLGVRDALWNEWIDLTDAVRDAVGEVAVCWLAGSYFSDKAQPDDIDCLYVIRRERVAEAAIDHDKARFLQAIIGRGAREVFGLRVDTYILDWWPRPGTHRGSVDRQSTYLQNRGYWDDLWSRRRDSDLKLDALPRRGYLEVMIDGYR